MKLNHAEIQTVLDGLERLIRQNEDAIARMSGEIQHLEAEIRHFETIRTEFLQLPLSEFV